MILGGGVVLGACLAWILYGPADVLPPTARLVAGIGVRRRDAPLHSDQGSEPAADERHRDRRLNFINFTFSALLGPVFGGFLRDVSGGVTPMSLEHYQAAFSPLLYGVALAIGLTLCSAKPAPAQERS